MLEIRNVTKVYRSKTGEEVRALDNVSITFPESGMVFILGKSGSGKSTLLNVMGGLDSYDSGEFIIKGKSSNDFVGSDFDAYRNTFIGFIFQEYNVLDDFTVGANIGLALELQGKKATEERINEILASVDLTSYAHRKPNELSGGQKQRVAIARALVKEPQIIMADEPTGALDSNTGKQIFDTLKELSREKLVLIVSHDRDFAERYADRIIELADGKIIDDVTKHERESERLSDGIRRIGKSILHVEKGYQLTAKDLEMINAYLRENGEDMLISGDKRVNDELRTAAGISEKGSTAIFEVTDAKRDVKIKEYDGKKTAFIHSKLPMKNAVKMGASGLKHKKFRLVMTILLSLVSFAMFGLADTMAAYDKITSSTQSIIDANVKNASMTLGVRHTSYHDGKASDPYYNYAAMNDSDIAWLKENTGLDFVPVYTGYEYAGQGSAFSLKSYFSNYESNDVYTGELSGVVNMSADSITGAGFTVTGKLPEQPGEIAITEFMYRQFNEYGFRGTSDADSVKAGELTMTTDGSANSIIGKKIRLESYHTVNGEDTLTVVGVVNTQFDYMRYEKYLPAEEEENGFANGPKEEEGYGDYILRAELENDLAYGFHALCFLHGDDIAILVKNRTGYREIGTYMDAWQAQMYITVRNKNSNNGTEGGGIGGSAIGGSAIGGIVVNKKDFVVMPGINVSYGNTYHRVLGSNAIPELNVTWLDPNRTDFKLGANEVIVNNSLIENMMPTSATVTVSPEDFRAILENAGYRGEELDKTDANKSYLERARETAVRSYIYRMTFEDANSAVTLKALYDHRAAFVDGYTPDGGTMTAQEGYDYWIERLFGINDWRNPLWDGRINEYIEEGYSNRDELMEEADLKLAIYAATTYYGITWSDAYADNKGTFSSLFYDLNANDCEHSLGTNEIWDALCYLYASQDIKTKELWKNETLIQALVNAEYRDTTRDEWNSYKDDRKIDLMQSYYRDCLYGRSSNSLYDENPYGTYNGKQLERHSEDRIAALSGVTLQDMLSQLVFERFEDVYAEDRKSNSLGTYDFTVVGTYEMDGNSNLIISDTVLADYKTWKEAIELESGYSQDIAEHMAGNWAFALAPLNGNEDVVRKLVEMTYANGVDLRYQIHNSVMQTLNEFNDFIEVGSKIFLYVGLGFALFSALLLMNFIATSISYKKREIGILRAVGARSSDVFKIFFSESLIIAGINFVLSAIACCVAVIAVNTWMHNEGIRMTLLNFGIRQIILMMAVSVLVALLASFLPVYSIARKKPVDAIRDR